MKTLIFALILLTSFSAYAQNWALLDTTSCSTGFSSLGASFSLEQKRGLIGEHTDVNNENFETKILIGSKINGVEEGSFEVITGIETQASLQSFQLYPNPANNYINLTVNGFHLGSTYSIVDINGQMSANGDLSKQTINIGHLEPGIYFFKGISKQKTFTLKFLKQDF